MENKTLNFQKAAIHYSVTGTGRTVVLLHGFGEDGTVWEPQVRFLKDQFRLIVPDIPGSGASEFLIGANIEMYADIIKAICDLELSTVNSTNRDMGKPVLIGHSMGGYITLAFAEKYPEDLEMFGLFHSSAFADTDEKKQTRNKAIAFIREKGAATFLKTSIPDLFTKKYVASHPGRVRGLIEKGNAFTEAALVQYYEAMIARPDRTALLKNFARPVLFIIGEHDMAIPLDISLQQCYLPAISQVHILNDSAHMGMWEEEDKCNNILLDFLTGLSDLRRI